ncbi:hypothetical protein GW17_00023217, partial [Ensete ventricosum]
RSESDGVKRLISEILGVVRLGMEGSEGGAPSPTVAVTVTAAADATGSHQPPSAALAAAVVREEKPASEISGMAAEPIKKRGRPRKYGPDGCLLRPLNPMSISASVPAGVRMPSTSRILFSFLNCIGAGEMEASSAGTNFTPHVITVASGEVVVGSFLPSYQMEQKIKKKPRLEAGSASTPPSAIPSSSADAEEAFGSGQGQHDQAATGKPDPSTTSQSSPFGEESWAAALRSVPADFNMSLPGG